MPEILTRTYAFIVTNAPVAYDYGQTIPIDLDRVSPDTMNEDDQYVIYRAKEKGDTVRAVMVPAESVNYQRDRYLSGCYVSIIVSK